MLRVHVPEAAVSGVERPHVLRRATGQGSCNLANSSERELLPRVLHGDLLSRLQRVLSDVMGGVAGIVPEPTGLLEEAVSLKEVALAG